MRGDTYYIADGVYPSYKFDDPESGSELIYIGKATGNEHGTDTGWDDSYGDGQAVFASMTFREPYFHIDGKTGEGVSGYGIKVYQSNLSGKCIDIRNHGKYNSHHITIEHVECEHAGMDREGGNNADIIYMLGGDGRYVNNVTFRNVYAHDVTRTIIFARRAQFITFDHCFFENCQNDVGVHGEGVSWDNSGEMHVTWKYCTWKDIEGAGIIIIGLDHKSAHSELDIFGNVFYTTDPEKFTCTDGIIASLSKNAVSNARVYNNTFFGIASPFASLGIVSWNAGAHNQSYNNLISDLGKPGTWRNCDHDYNAYHRSGSFTEMNGQILTESPFVNSKSFNFHLRVPTKLGLKLDDPYDIDLEGNRRGMDGVWDRGAYEFKN